jgi:hypothetical protein
MSDLIPRLLFGIFALLSAVGAYLIFARFRSRKAGVGAALATGLLFGAIFLWLEWMMSQAGLR